jgi:hypothetical protein
MLRRVFWQKFTDVSEVLAAFITTSVNFCLTTRRNIPEDIFQKCVISSLTI